MKEEMKQTAEAIASHPKTAVAVTGLANLNVWWLDYGEPIIKALTSLVGLAVVILLMIKHFLDLKDRISKKSEEEQK